MATPPEVALRWIPLAALAVACSGKDGADTSDSAAADSDADTDADADADGDADADSDADSDADEEKATVGGSVLGFDGQVPGIANEEKGTYMEVQVCDLVCYSYQTDADGGFASGEIDAATYKVDALGDTLDGRGYGRARVPIELQPGEALVLPYTIVLPPIEPAQSARSGTYTFGRVAWTVDAMDLDPDVGAPESPAEVAAGYVAPEYIPPAWEWTTPPAFAVAFLPFAVTPLAPIELEVSGVSGPANWEVYAVAGHGELEGPIGSATLSGDVLATADSQPSKLTWLFFVPIE
jgi:hypothetical protein